MVEEGGNIGGDFSGLPGTESLPEAQAAFPRTHLQLLVGLIALITLYLTSQFNYLLFHTLAEMFSVVIACGIFMIAWNSRRFMGSSYFLFLGIAYIFVGGLDMFHVMTYKGMGIFDEADTNLPTQLWIAARYLESLSLLAAAVVVGRGLRARFVLIGYASVSSLLLIALFYFDLFPDCFVEGAGLTPFKKISEYVISLILVGTVFALVRKRDEFDSNVFRLLIASIAITICSELAFTYYIDAYDFSNFVGHFFKIISFYLIYKAIIETGLAKPYDLLFRNLKQNEEEIRKSEKLYRVLSESLEEMVKEKVAELQQAENLAAMGRMVSTVAHEVRNPLQNIQMGVDAMKREVQDDTVKMEILDEIDYGVDMLNNIVRELLDYSRPAKLHYSQLPVSKIVDQALKGVSPSLESIECQVELEDGDREIAIDAVKSTEVLVNLIANAVDAMPTGGTLMISSRFHNEDGAENLRLSLTDTGCGMSEEILERICEPFFTTKTNGTGLGIPTCRKIVEAHGGKINVTSKIDHGTTVEIILPVKDAS
jgi:signal transduction histidine kinase